MQPFGNERTHWFAWFVGLLLGVLLTSALVRVAHPVYDCTTGELYNPHTAECLLP